MTTLKIICKILSMNANVRFLSILCLNAIILFSCNKPEGDAPAPPVTKTTDIYAAGFNNGKIVYWKNNVETPLATATDAGVGGAYGIAVSGTDVYVAGKLNFNAVYWKNGVMVPLYNETDGFKEARAIAVNGNDVYITGLEAFSSTGQNIFLWKNGVKTILLPVINTGTKRQATGIALAGSDVYVSGTAGSSAVYWKNGVEHVVSDQSAEATGIVVSGSDVYVSGKEGIQAVYWKNGVKTVLTPLTSGIANGILVSGSDVYVVGISDGQAAMWKNNVQTTLDPSYSATATAIVNSGNEIFIAGKIATASSTTCVYWQNGIKKELATVTNDPLQLPSVNAITVVTR
jgi:hypothetical protein